MGSDAALADVATDEEFTIDEIARRTGMTVRTVRYYASEGLLPPPIRRGRIAVYGTAHRMRLDLVKQLQDHGYTLAAIERVLARIPLDASPADFTVQSALLTPWTPEAAERLDHAALEARAGRALREDDLDLLLSMGIIERDGEQFETTPSLLGIGLELLDLPLPTAVLRESAEVIDRHAVLLADELSNVFRQHVWAPYRQGDVSESDREQLAMVLKRLRPLAVQGLVTAFGRASDRAARRSLTD